MYKRSIKLMFITQTNDFGSVIWKIEQHICQSKKVTNFTPPLPPKYSMLKNFDVIQKLVQAKTILTTKSTISVKSDLKTKKSPFFKFKMCQKLVAIATRLITWTW